MINQLIVSMKKIVVVLFLLIFPLLQVSAQSKDNIQVLSKLRGELIYKVDSTLMRDINHSADSELITMRQSRMSSDLDTVVGIFVNQFKRTTMSKVDVCVYFTSFSDYHATKRYFIYGTLDGINIFVLNYLIYDERIKHFSISRYRNFKRYYKYKAALDSLANYIGSAPRTGIDEVHLFLTYDQLGSRGAASFKVKEFAGDSEKCMRLIFDFQNRHDPIPK